MITQKLAKISSIVTLTAVLLFPFGAVYSGVKSSAQTAGPEGPIVQAGTTVLAAAGDFNLSFGGFGNSGKVITPIAGEQYGSAVALQPDGKIVLAGRSGGHFTVVRYNPNGSLDITFGDGGIVRELWGDVAAPTLLPSNPTARS